LQSLVSDQQESRSAAARSAGGSTRASQERVSETAAPIAPNLGGCRRAAVSQECAEQPPDAPRVATVRLGQRQPRIQSLVRDLCQETAVVTRAEAHSRHGGAVVHRMQILATSRRRRMHYLIHCLRGAAAVLTSALNNCACRIYRKKDEPRARDELLARGAARSRSLRHPRAHQAAARKCVCQRRCLRVGVPDSGCPNLRPS